MNLGLAETLGEFRYPEPRRGNCISRRNFVYHDGMSLQRPTIILLILFCSAVVFPRTGGGAESAAMSDGLAYFEKHIRPLLIEHCYSCHQDRQEGGLRLDHRQGLLDGGDSGPAISPGDTEASLLIKAVRYDDPDLQMPPDEKLSQAEIKHLEHWVRFGAPDPRDKSDETKPDGENPSDPIAGRQHWAFRPLDVQAPPAVRATDWPRSTIDTHVLSKLESQNLHPAADANRRDLIRRVTLLLTGLPPRPDQVTAFLQDNRRDAYARLVDQLLSSPEFGEHWGRHWLDLARYADSNGLDENFLFREAWRYRNWVIAAVNADIPYDRFLLEQIAGDLLPFDSIEQRDRQRIAAGFLVVGPKVLLGNVEQKQKMEIADEQLDTIGRAVLGQTLGCARCHDHKFDPVPTSDYYAMAGILTSTRVVERRYMLGQQRAMERLVGLGDDGNELDEAYEEFWRQRPALNERIKRAKSALDLIQKDNIKELETLAKKHADSVAPAAIEKDQTKQQRTDSQKGLIAELAKKLADPAQKIPPRAMIPTDVESPGDEHIRLAGQFDRLGKQVPRGLLTVLGGDSVTIGPGQSGRIEMAHWLTDHHDGAGNLAARVLTNRIWRHLIGRGIVATADNFGRTGEAATHPELLDHLASELVRSGWSIKELIRTIVLSRTFTMASAHNNEAHARDPGNQWLWRAHRRRLSPEALRDSMLLAAGKLDLAPMESSVWYLGDQATAVGANTNRRRTDFPCRSVYLPVIRNDLPELFEAFDFADPHIATGVRSETMVPVQGLYLLNDDSVQNAAEATARRIFTECQAGTPQSKIDRMFRSIVGDLPADDQRQELLRFIDQTEKRLRAAGREEPEIFAWTTACHALFASSRFQMLE